MCATPLLMTKLPLNSENSVFLLLSAPCVCCPFNVPSLALASLMVRAMSMPLIAPSRRFTAALPFKARLSAPTVAPVVRTSTLTLPLPSSVSLLARSLSSGAIITPLKFCLMANDGAACAALMVAAPFIAPPYKFADSGLTVTWPPPALISSRTLLALRFEAFNVPMLILPLARRLRSAVTSIGLSPPPPAAAVPPEGGAYLSTSS